jgi:hypothetical protein
MAAGPGHVKEPSLNVARYAISVHRHAVKVQLTGGFTKASEDLLASRLAKAWLYESKHRQHDDEN